MDTTLHTIGVDMRGNPIVYRDNQDGTWSNLTSGHTFPDSFIAIYFPHLLQTQEVHMPASFQKATKRQSRLRLALIGPAGSGKTYSALRLAAALAQRPDGTPGRIALIDTERGSASKYAHKFTFDVFEPDRFAPEVYIDAIRAAETAGYDVLVIDSLSHAWSGKGGILEYVDQETRRSASHNAYTDGWRKATPKHNELVDAMLSCSMHLIVTMRSRTDYVLEKDDKGRTVPRRVGLQPIQRDGIEFEFDVVGDLTLDNDYIISKTRCEALAGSVISKPGEVLAAILHAWLTDGAPDPADLSPSPFPEGKGNGVRSSEPVSSPSPVYEPVPSSQLPTPPVQAQDSVSLPSPTGRGQGEGFSFPRRVSWTADQLQPAVDSGLCPHPNQVAAALNLSALPEDAAPGTCRVWVQTYALGRHEGLDPQAAASQANTRMSLP